MARFQYHDVMLVPQGKPKPWHKKRGRYYPTGTRKMSDGRLEVTFYLPPSVLSQWRQAITAGKRIRLFVPR